MAKIPFRILSNPSVRALKIMNHHRVSRRNFIKTTALAMPFIASGCAHLATGSKRGDEFVSVRSGQFQLRGRPYFYVGTNLWYGCYVSDAALPGGRQRLVRELVAPLGQDRVLSTDIHVLADAIERGHFTARVRAE